MTRDQLDDYLGHALLNWLAPGAVDPRQHNAQPDGEPHGDCYKCRRVRDFLRAALRGETNLMYGTWDEENDRARGLLT